MIEIIETYLAEIPIALRPVEHGGVEAREVSVYNMDEYVTDNHHRMRLKKWKNYHAEHS